MWIDTHTHTHTRHERAFPATLEVEYVRVFQEVPAAAAPAGGAGGGGAAAHVYPAPAEC